MRSTLAILLVVTLIFGGGYWYRALGEICAVPMGYHVGAIDPRFSLTEDRVREVIDNAAELWESRVGTDLFEYNENGPLTVNFVYDERQERVDDESRLRGVLEDKESVSENVRVQYETLLSKYSKLKSTYEARVKQYETQLAAHNREVREWNERGGAPKDVFERLREDEKVLGEETTALSRLATDLNELVRNMNILAARGNSIVADYNKTVNTYNARVGGTEAFTQGEYHDRTITIFEYVSEEELTLVLAHELGHALALDHVEDETSLMYYLMDKQTVEKGASESDLEEFVRRCGDGTLSSRLVQALKEVVRGFRGST